MYDNIVSVINMMKKLISVCLVCFLAVCAASCANNGDSKTSTISETETVKSTVSETVTSTVSSTAESTSSAKTVFDKALLKKDSNGFLSYSDDGVSSEIGVDVSSYSGDVDWNGLYDKGVRFAIIRAGGRGYGDEGALYCDESLTYNLSAANAAGIDTGVYFFSQATSVDEAEEEADYVLSLIEGRAVSYVAYDFERIEDDEARTDSVNNEDIPSFAAAFCGKVSEKNYQPLIYLGSEEMSIYSSVTDIPLWVACYKGAPEITEQVRIWQYKKSVQLPEASGGADLNIMFKRNP